MHWKMCVTVLSLVTCVLCVTAAFGQEEAMGGSAVTEVMTFKPDFLSPSEVLSFLGVQAVGGHGVYKWRGPDRMRIIEIHYNDAANLLILSGEAADLEHVTNLISEADIPPRQIEIEVQIVEVSTSKAKDLGIDWQRVLDTSHPRFSWTYYESDTRQYDSQQLDDRPEDWSWRRSKDLDERFNAQGGLDLAEVLEILDESGAGTVRSVPRIMTLNNRRATILDGERITYVTRYSSYTNLFEADSMDAGLTLSILPSLGESGYITLEITAELTSLVGDISGSPIKSGQMLDNTVIVRDGESVSLGGLTRTIEETVDKRFPVLGHILPFLFSRKITEQEEIESHIVLTPRIVDFMIDE